MTSVSGEDLAEQLRAISDSIDALTRAVTTQNGRVTRAEQWIDAHQVHSDSVNVRLDALDTQVTAMQETIPTEHALRVMFREEAQALKEETELRADAHRYRQLRTLIIRGVGGALTSGVVITAIVGWLVA